MFKGRVIFYENKGKEIKMMKKEFDSFEKCDNFVKSTKGPLFIQDLYIPEIPLKIFRKTSKKLKNKVMNLFLKL